MMIYLIAQIVSLISLDIRTGKIYKGIIIESFLSKIFLFILIKLFICIISSALVSIVYLITFIIVITQHFSFPILIVN
jgi:hypothetical protein